MNVDELPKGWVTPMRSRTVAEVKALILERQREVAQLELELFNLQQGPRLQAIATIRSIMRAHELTADDVGSKPAQHARAVGDGSVERKMTAATMAARLARFDRLIAEYEARVSSLQATPACTPAEKRALTLAVRALARHKQDRGRFLARFHANVSLD